MTGFPLRQTIKRRFLVTNLIEFCLLLVIGRRLQSALDRSRSKFSPPCQVADRYVPWVLARDFSCAVSGFGQVFIVTRPFLSQLRPSVDHDTEESRPKREKPLVPKYQLRDPKFVQSVNDSCSLQFHLNACSNLYHECVQLRTQLSICLSSYVSISHGDISGEFLTRGGGGI